MGDYISRADALRLVERKLTPYAYSDAGIAVNYAMMELSDEIKQLKGFSDRKDERLRFFQLVKRIGWIWDSFLNWKR